MLLLEAWPKRRSVVPPAAARSSALPRDRVSTKAGVHSPRRRRATRRTPPTPRLLERRRRLIGDRVAGGVEHGLDRRARPQPAARRHHRRRVLSARDLSDRFLERRAADGSRRRVLAGGRAAGEAPRVERAVGRERRRVRVPAGVDGVLRELRRIAQQNCARAHPHSTDRTAAARLLRRRRRRPVPTAPASASPQQKTAPSTASAASEAARRHLSVGVPWSELIERGQGRPPFAEAELALVAAAPRVDGGAARRERERYCPPPHDTGVLQLDEQLAVGRTCRRGQLAMRLSPSVYTWDECVRTAMCRPPKPTCATCASARAGDRVRDGCAVPGWSGRPSA